MKELKDILKELRNVLTEIRKIVKIHQEGWYETITRVGARNCVRIPPELGFKKGDLIVIRFRKVK